MIHMLAGFVLVLSLGSASALAAPAAKAKAAPPEPAAPNAEIEELKARLDGLEAANAELVGSLSERKGLVSSFLQEDDIYLGGFFETGFTGLAGPNTDAQLQYFGNLLGLNIAADFEERLRFVSQFVSILSIGTLNPQGDPRGVPPKRAFGINPANLLVNIVAQAYVEYSLTDSLRLQGGIGYVPFGIYAQKRETVLYIRRGGPQLLRTTNLFSALWEGLHLSNAPASGQNRVEWNLYTFLTAANLKFPGLGARAKFIPANDGFGIGASAQVTRNAFGSTDHIVGADVGFEVGRFGFSAELARNLTRNADPWSAYVEPTFKLLEGNVLLYAFADFASSPSNRTATPSLSDPYDKMELGGGINWLPTSYTRFRLGVTHGNYIGGDADPGGQSRDFTTLDLSAGVAF